MTTSTIKKENKKQEPLFKKGNLLEGTTTKNIYLVEGKAGVVVIHSDNPNNIGNYHIFGMLAESVSLFTGSVTLKSTP